MNDEKRIILDFSEADSLSKVHDLLKQAFGFSEYYGGNWDALSDCLGDFCSDGAEHTIELRGFYGMEIGLRAKCAPMLKVFGDAQEEWGNIEFTVVS